MQNPQYLGDGVYIHTNPQGQLVLTTGHHDPRHADNTIYLEPQVLQMLQKYIQQHVQ